MPLTPGTRFGPYELADSLGAGGMGEVYRARDSKLHRDVALKVLPTDVANDAERLARFRREAQLLAALNHPNIAHVYGLEESGGTTALVMELVHGEDLSRRLTRGPLPVAEALSIARQIAAALEAAHEAGIVHRDLKPANIKLDEDGTVKVLDFGLAKGVDRDHSAEHRAEMGDSPTITTPAHLRQGYGGQAMTEVGMILGTAAYMSPEQAKGRPVDKRADVWAFGCVLYEMLSGVRAFAGDDVTDTMAAILRAEPDWSKLPADLPESARQLVRGCLDKDRRTRVPDIGVARYLLDERFGRVAVPALSPVARAPSRRVAAFAVGAFALGALFTVGLFRLRPAVSEAPSNALRVSAMPDYPVYSAPIGGTLAIASDASFFVYVTGTAANESYLVVRPINQLTGTRLDGTNNARFPFVSPDNKWIGFFAGGELKKIAVSEGAPVRLCAYVGLPRGATWGEDGSIVFGSTLDLGLMQVPASGGVPKPITRTLDETNRPMHIFPSFLPGGNAILFSIVSPGISPTIATLDVKTGAISPVVQSNAGFIPIYLPSGHLVFDRGGELLAAPFDVSANAVSGDTVTVASGLYQSAGGYASFAASQNGVLVYAPATGNVAMTSRTLVWVDRRGVETPIGVPTRSYEVARVSPDGIRIAVDSRDEESDIWIWDTARRTLSRLTVGPTDEMAPLWSSDGASLLYSSNRPGLPNIYRQRADGAGSIERLTDSRMTQFLTSLGPGDAQLAMFEFTDAGESLSLASIREGNLPATNTQVLIKSDSHHRFGAEISPDGRWLAFHSNESGRHEVYVRPFPVVDGGRWQISANGGTRAAWSRDGKELFYLDASGLLTSVNVSVTGDRFSAGTPTQILKTPYVAGLSARGLDLRSYDVSADGQRFLMVKDVPSKTATATPAPIVIVTRWLEELKQRVPGK